MSMIEKLEQKLDRVIKSATEHARFSGKLNEDMAAIESKVAARLDAAMISLSSEVDARLSTLKGELLGDCAGLSTEAADAFDKTVWDLAGRAASAAGPGDDQRIDPNTGRPVTP